MICNHVHFIYETTCREINTIQLKERGRRTYSLIFEQKVSMATHWISVTHSTPTQNTWTSHKMGLFEWIPLAKQEEVYIKNTTICVEKEHK